MGTASVPWGVGPRDQEEFSPVLERAGEPMARRTFDVVDVTEILIHWYAGRSISEVSTSLAVDRKTIRKYVGPAVAEEVRRDQVVVLRDEDGVPPGEEAQIDYGHLGYFTDPVGGRRRKVWAFAMVLSCSRHMFVRPVFTMDQESWTQAHVEAFAFFGGVPRRLVPDNLRTGVDKPDLYDPKINRSYAELAEHYRVLVDPARSRKPRAKARIERPMPYIRDSYWRGREFTSLDAMQAAAIVWCTEVAGRRSCRPLQGAAPGSVFAAVEAQALQPLPVRPFVLASWS